MLSTTLRLQDRPSQYHSTPSIYYAPGIVAVTSTTPVAASELPPAPTTYRKRIRISRPPPKRTTSTTEAPPLPLDNEINTQNQKSSVPVNRVRTRPGLRYTSSTTTSTESPPVQQVASSQSSSPPFFRKRQRPAILSPTTSTTTTTTTTSRPSTTRQSNLVVRRKLFRTSSTTTTVAPPKLTQESRTSEGKWGGWKPFNQLTVNSQKNFLFSCSGPNDTEQLQQHPVRPGPGAGLLDNPGEQVCE